MKKFAVLLLLFLAACGTTKTVVDTVEVPQPYFDAPPRSAIKELPTRAKLETDKVTPEQAKTDPLFVHRAVGEDIRALIEENETIRFMYAELVRFITVTWPAEVAKKSEENTNPD